jgi:hypothetical protein
MHATHTTPLRERMRQELQLAGLSERTQEAYLRAVRQLPAQAIRRLAADPRFVGTLSPGFLGVLHTWGRTLEYICRSLASRSDRRAAPATGEAR